MDKFDFSQNSQFVLEKDVIENIMWRSKVVCPTSTTKMSNIVLGDVGATWCLLWLKSNTYVVKNGCQMSCLRFLRWLILGIELFLSKMFDYRPLISNNTHGISQLDHVSYLLNLTTKPSLCLWYYYYLSVHHIVVSHVRHDLEMSKVRFEPSPP